MPPNRSWDDAYTLAKTALAKLSIDDKITIVTGNGWMKGTCLGNIDPVYSIGFKGLCSQDAPTGVRFADHTSAFAAAINVAATFDRTLMENNGIFLGQEYRGKGINIINGPMVNMIRAPAAGRNWESNGADPYLASVSASLQTRGIQNQGVIATAKHFIGNEQEHWREFISSNIDDRTLHEIYLPPFKACVKEGLGSVMCSYNLINNTYACENPRTMNEILKGELNFRGFVMTDWWAAHSTENTANHGADVMFPGGKDQTTYDSWFGPNLKKAVQSNTVPQARLDDMVTRVLAAWYRHNQDNGFPDVNINSWNQGASKHVDVQDNHKDHIRAVGAASSILVKNDGRVLPLAHNKKIAVVGTDATGGDSTNNANSCPDHGCSSGTIAQGWGSGTSNFPYIITPFDGIKNRGQSSGNNVWSYFDNYNLQAAQDASKGADVAIVFAHATSGEEYITVNGNMGDRNDLNLWDNGDKLIEAVAAVNPNTVVVLHTPGAVDMPWINNPNISAVIYALFPGQESGNSIADVLYGDVNPSGRLPFTVNSDRSKYAADVVYDKNPPAGFQYPQVNYNEGIFVDYRWNDAKNIDPVFAFGHGLSYTKFEYSGLTIEPATAPTNFGKITVSVTIKNSGNFDGNEVAQVYIGFPESVVAPPKQLKGFDRKLVAKGAQTVFTFPLTTEELSYWDVVSQSWVVPKGTFKVFIGASSRDIRLTGTITIQ